MIIVSDTSPLNYLILIAAVDLLPELFGRVIIPESVARELAHDRAPEHVRSWIAGPPSWLEVRAPKAPDLNMKLDVGERDALSLALELEADLVLVDDRAARRVAKDRRISVDRNARCARACVAARSRRSACCARSPHIHELPPSKRYDRGSPHRARSTTDRTS